jgi:hypothetical protein
MVNVMMNQIIEHKEIMKTFSSAKEGDATPHLLIC